MIVAAGLDHDLDLDPAEERRVRMSRMRDHVREHNIYRWAGSLIAELTSIRVEEFTPPAAEKKTTFPTEKVAAAIL